MSEPFVAEIRIFAGSFAPRSWAFCKGDLLPISSNTALFSLLGTIYGGDGRTTFALPNLKGRAPMGWGRGPGLTDRRIGQRGGTEAVTLSEAQMPNHTHTLRAFVEEGADQLNPAGNVLGAAATNIYHVVGTKVAMADQGLPPAGGSQPHDNMQPYLVLNYIIALVGLFPSRS